MFSARFYYLSYNTFINLFTELIFGFNVTKYIYLCYLIYLMLKTNIDKFID